MNAIIYILLDGWKEKMTLPIRVGIVDDHPGVRDGIRRLLTNAHDIEVAGEGENGEEAIHLAQSVRPDILLLDVELPILRGDLVMQYLRDNHIDVKVLAVSSYDDPAYVRGMLENGAAGYIIKEEAPALLLEAIHCIILDEIKWVSPLIATKSITITLRDVALNGFEIEILRELLMNRSDEEIIYKNKIDQTQLTKYLEKIMEKVHVSTRDELRRAAECLLTTELVRC